MNNDTKKIQSLLLNHLKNRPDFNLITTNYSWNLLFEADVYQVTKNLFTVEYEIKTSRGDFLKDFKKSKKIYNKHTRQYDCINKHDLLKNNDIIRDKKRNKFLPNKFFFVTPIGLISRNEIDDCYGLIEVLESGQVVISKRPKKLHSEKRLSVDDMLDIARNFSIKQCSL